MQLGELGLQVGNLLMQATAPGEGFTGKVLAPLGQSRTSLILEGALLLRESLELQFDALAARGNVRHTSAHLLQELELLLIGIVEGLPGILGPIKCLGCLGLEDHREALPQTHVHSLNSTVAQRAPTASA